MGSPEWRVILREASEKVRLAEGEFMGVFCSGPGSMAAEVRQACGEGVPRAGGWLSYVPMHVVEAF